APAVLRARHLAAVRARYHVNALLAGLQEVRAAAGVPDLWTVRAVRPLYGVGQVRSRLAELLAGVQGEYLSMQPEPAFDAAAVRAAAPLDRAVCARGVSMLSLGVPAAEEDASTAHGAELRASGVRYRELPLLPAKLMIFSRRTVLLGLVLSGYAAELLPARVGTVVDATGEGLPQ